MTGWPRTRRAAVLGAALLTVVAPVPGAVADEGRAPSTRLFSFDDADIFESSGLVDRGRVVYTINDSGDDAVIYGVDSRTGRTVSRTTYADEATDVEAIAPGSHGTVWVGDTGDNRRNRDSIRVSRVRPTGGDQPAERYALRYPDGAHDAEALLVQPRTQRVFVVTKSPFGGTVYVAPRRLREKGVNRLRRFAQVTGLVTDGTFFPDGRHVLLRTYGDASAYSFPGFAQLASVRLPSQPQGEGISVGTSGRVLVSSEGLHSQVRRVQLPVAMTRPPARSRAPSPPPAPPSETGPGAGPRSVRQWAGIAAIAAVVGGLGLLTLRGSRIRSSKR